MKVLQTKFVGYAPDPERLHDERPQLVYEIVGEVTAPKPRMPLQWRLVCMAGLLWIAYNGASILNGNKWLFQ